jgi:ADP-heptose:LPS heptosyltransferase
MDVVTLGSEFNGGPDNVVDTAAVMQSLDLIISSDTAVGHIAGAVGRPVSLLLKAVADWRWLRGRDDSPWYPSMRLFRQQTAGNWNEVIERVTADVGSRLAARPDRH